MELHKTLCHLFPDNQFGDWVLRDVGDGPYIAEWKRPNPEPTLSALDSITAQELFTSDKGSLLDAVRISREAIMTRLNGIAGRAQRAGDTATALACDAAVLALLGITTNAAVAAAGDAAALKTAIKNAYAVIALALPAGARSAFKGVDA